MGALYVYFWLRINCNAAPIEKKRTKLTKKQNKKKTRQMECLMPREWRSLSIAVHKLYLNINFSHKLYAMI